LALKKLGYTYFRMNDFRNGVETFKRYQVNKSVGLNRLSISEQIKVQANEIMLNLVVRNICSNGIKFSRKASEIIITSQANNDQH